MKKILKILFCTIALFSFVKIKLGGEFFFADFICLAVLPVALLRQDRRGLNVLFLPLGCILVLYALALDALVGTTSPEMLRAFARNITVVINFISISYLVARAPRDAVVVLPFVGASLVVFSLLQPTAFAVESPWKGGLNQGYLLMLVGVGVLALERTPPTVRKLAILGVSGLALTFAYQGIRYDSRTTLFVGLVGASFSLMFGLMRHVSRGFLLVVCLALLMVVPFYFEIYYSLAMSGIFGPEAAARMEIISKAHAGDTSVAASRQGTFDALEAAAQGFPIGLGSFPPGVSFHSSVITAVVETGVVGLLFWLNILIFAGSRLIREVPRIPGRTLGMFVMISIFFTSSVLFDPLQGYTRLYTPILFALLTNFLLMTDAQTRVDRLAAGLDRPSA